MRATSSLRRSPEAALAALAATTTAAFVWLPAPPAGPGPRREAGLTDAAADAVASYWPAGQRPLPAALDALVTYWRRDHAVKAVAAALATVAGPLWRRARRGRAVAAAAWSALAAANVSTALHPAQAVAAFLAG